MHGPENREGQGQLGGDRAKALPEPRLQESPPYNTQQGQSGEDMNGQIEGVITPDVQATDRVVDGERKIDERPALDGNASPTWRGQHIRDRPEMADGWVLHDRLGVVKDEWTGEAVVPGQQPRDDDHNQRYECSSFHRVTGEGMGIVAAAAWWYAWPLRYSCSRGWMSLATRDWSAAVARSMAFWAVATASLKRPAEA